MAAPGKCCKFAAGVRGMLACARAALAGGVLGRVGTGDGLGAGRVGGVMCEGGGELGRLEAPGLVSSSLAGLTTVAAQASPETNNAPSADIFRMSIVPYPCPARSADFHGCRPWPAGNCDAGLGVTDAIKITDLKIGRERPRSGVSAQEPRRRNLPLRMGVSACCVQASVPLTKTCSTPAAIRVGSS